MPLRHKQTPPAIEELLRNPPDSIYEAVEDARETEHNMMEGLPEMPNPDLAHKVMIDYYMEMSSMCMEIAKDLSQDRYSAEAITNGDQYFIDNNFHWSDLLEDCHNDSQFYRMAVNQALYGNLAIADQGHSDESPESLYETCNYAFSDLDASIGGRQQEITNALRSQNKIKSMLPDSQQLFEYANVFLDQAKITLSDWQASLPPLPPRLINDRAVTPQGRG